MEVCQLNYSIFVRYNFIKFTRLRIPVLCLAPAGMTSLIAELITREGNHEKG